MTPATIINAPDLVDAVRVAMPAAPPDPQKIAAFGKRMEAYYAGRRRRRAIAVNDFCPTGPGGGIDPTCSPGGLPGPRTKIRTQHTMHLKKGPLWKDTGGSDGGDDTTPAAKAPKIDIDYGQTDPHHPVAQRIRNDQQGKKQLESFLSKVKPHAEQAEEVSLLTDEHNRLFDAHHKTTMEYIDLMKRSKGKISAKRSAEVRALKEKVAALRDESDKVGKKLQEARIALEGLSDVGRRALLEVATVPDPYKVRYDVRTKAPDNEWEMRPLSMGKQAKEAVDKGLDFVSKLTGGGDASSVVFGLSERTDGRGYYRHGDREVALNDSARKADDGGTAPGMIGYYKDDTTRLVIHEIGHHLEASNSTLQWKTEAFLNYRLQGEPVVRMNTLPGMSKVFRDEEVGAKDRFDKAFGEVNGYYVGKQYFHKSTEVISMGLEKMYSDPVGFATKDPEYFQFMLSALRDYGKEVK